MSLDGFIAGPDDSMDWAFKAGGASLIADDVRAQTGAIAAGRRWYDVATSKYGMYGGAWSAPVFVVTHRPKDAAADTSVTVLSDGIARRSPAACRSSPSSSVSASCTPMALMARRTRVES
jgi:dihydrofolate reductase